MAQDFTPFITGPLLTFRTEQERDVANVPSTWEQGFAATFQDSFIGSPGPLLFRWLDRKLGNDTSSILTAEQANERFNIVGESPIFDAPISERQARMIYDATRNRLRREDIIRRSDLGGFGGFVAGLAGAALDPLSIAAAVVPGALAARLGFGAARVARLGIAGRAAYGAAEGALGTALVTPLTYGLSRAENRPYTLADAFLDVTFGGVMGAGLHAGMAAFERWRRGTNPAIAPAAGGSDAPMPVVWQALQDASPEFRATLLRGAVADVLEGRPVQVDALVNQAVARYVDRNHYSMAHMGEQETLALRAITEAERKNATGELNARIAELETDARAMRAEAAAAAARAGDIEPGMAQSRAETIQREWTAAKNDPARRRELEAEYRLVTRGNPTADMEDNLDVLRSLAEAQGLELAARRTEVARDRAVKTVQAREKTIAQAQREFRKASGQSASRATVIRAMTERTLRRVIGAKYGPAIDKVPVAEIGQSAERVLAAPKEQVRATITAEIERLSKLAEAAGAQHVPPPALPQVDITAGGIRNPVSIGPDPNAPAPQQTAQPSPPAGEPAAPQQAAEMGAAAAAPADRKIILRAVRAQEAGRPVDTDRVIKAVARGYVADRVAKAQMADPAFRDWFAGSVVADREGNPIRVFHGTEGAFDRFAKEKLGEATRANSAKEGFFFTDDPRLASSYVRAPEGAYNIGLGGFVNRLLGGRYAALNEAILRLLRAPSARVEGANVRPSYLALKNPSVVEYAGGSYRDISFSKVIKEAKAAGHDGVILRNTVDPGFSERVSGTNAEGVVSDVYVVFEPEQIRSTYDVSPEAQAALKAEADARAAQAPTTPLSAQRGQQTTGISLDLQGRRPQEQFVTANRGAVERATGDTVQGGVPSVDDAWGRQLEAMTKIARGKLAPYINPVDKAASDAVRDNLAAQPTPAKSQINALATGETSPELQELEALTAPEAEAVAELKRMGTLTEGEANYIAEADEQIARTKEIGRVRQMAAVCMSEG